MSYPDTTHHTHHTDHTNHPDLAQHNAAHFDAIAHEHAHSHHVKQVASKIAHKIVELLGLPSKDGQGDDGDDDDNDNDKDKDNDSDNHGDNDEASKTGITVLDYACGTGQSPTSPSPSHPIDFSN